MWKPVGFSGERNRRSYGVTTWAMVLGVFKAGQATELGIVCLTLVLILTAAPLAYFSSAGLSTPKSFSQSGQQPDFQIGVAPNQFLAPKTQGGAMPSVVLTSIWGFVGNVALSARVVPAEISAPRVSLPSSIMLDASPGSPSVSMQVLTTSTTSLGLYTITVTGTSGSISHSATAQVGVTGQFVGANTAYLVYKEHYIGLSYPGGSTLVNNTFDSLGDLGVHITKLVISLDFGTYSEDLNIQLGHFEEGATSMAIPIPSSAYVGNHVLTARVSWEYYSQFSPMPGQDLVLSSSLPVASRPSPSPTAPANLADFLNRTYKILLPSLGLLSVLAVLAVFLVHRHERRKKAELLKASPDPFAQTTGTLVTT